MVQDEELGKGQRLAPYPRLDLTQIGWQGLDALQVGPYGLFDGPGGLAGRVSVDVQLVDRPAVLVPTQLEVDGLLDIGRADLVFVARVLLADPAWPLRAAKALGVKPELPPPYWRATLS